jgi:hypothetical protein
MWLHRLKVHELNAFCTDEVELPLKLLMNHEVSISADSLSLRLLLIGLQTTQQTTAA